MTGKHDIEARLDRSLTNQIEVPRLERRFDAAVWARIESADATATNPGAKNAAGLEEWVVASRVRATRWLAISNVIGATVVVALLAYFGLSLFTGTGVNVEAAASVPMPQIPEATVEQIVGMLGNVLGFAMLAFGVSLTSFGRRLRASFS